MYEISDDIPIPTVRASATGTEKYGWSKLKKGQSIFVPASEADPHDKDLQKLRTRVYQSARTYGAKNGKKFLALVVEEDAVDKEARQEWLDGDHTEGDDAPDFKIKVRGVRCWYEDDIVK